jgi:large-conductance mechanosensitive channel
MREIVVYLVIAILVYVLVLYVINKIKRKIAKKKRLKDDEYMLDFTRRIG